MSRFPWARTDPEVLPTLKHVLIAGVAAYAIPVVLGLSVALSMAEASIGSRFPTLYVISAFAAYSGLFSWLGVIPGALGHRLISRAGYGGLLPCLGLALIMGAVISTYLGLLALIFALPVSAIYWLVLWTISGRAIVAA